MSCEIEPSRIVLARRLKTWSRTDLAKALDVSLGAVSQWESGKKDPSSRIEDLVEKLGQPEGFFVGNSVPTSDPKAISFRKRQDASRNVRDRAAATVDYAAGVLTPGKLSVFGRLPQVLLPSYSNMTPTAAADALRREWGLTDGPLRNVVEQLEAKGALVFWINEPSPSLSAFCKWVDNRPLVVLNSARRDGCRSRFDACHELGHLVLHQDVNFDEADPKVIEREADAFASAFLMPRDTFMEDAPKTFDRDYLLSLKRTWGVSVQAMVRRLFDLRIFSDWQYESAYRQMSMWGWRRAPEPFAGQLESSRLHWLLCDRLEQQDLSPSRFVASIDASWHNAKEMMPVLAVRELSLKIPGAFDNDFDPLLAGDSVELPYDD